MPKATGKPGFFAVKVGRETGIFSTWEECETSISGFPGNKHKKFPTRAQAEEWLHGGAHSSKSTPISTQTAASSATRVPAQTVVSQNSGGSTSFNAFASTAVPLGPDELVIYSDGACKGNGQAGSIAGVGVWWGHNHPKNLAERCPGRQTNNRAELIALVRVLEQCKNIPNDLRIKTDSQYSIKCVNEWLPGWQRRNFHKSNGDPVENASLIRYFAKLLERSAVLKRRVTLEYVKGHAGIEGNEMADSMANRGVILPEEEERDWEFLAQVVDAELTQHFNSLKKLKPTSSPMVVKGNSQLPEDELAALAELADADDFDLSD